MTRKDTRHCLYYPVTKQADHLASGARCFQVYVPSYWLSSTMPHHFSSASEFEPSTLETYKYLSNDFDFQTLQYFAEMSRRTLELSQENRLKSLSEPLIISMTCGGCL